MGGHSEGTGWKDKANGRNRLTKRGDEMEGHLINVFMFCSSIFKCSSERSMIVINIG